MPLRASSEKTAKTYIDAVGIWAGDGERGTD